MYITNANFRRLVSFLSVDEIDLTVFHQANYIISEIFSIPEQKSLSASAYLLDPKQKDKSFLKLKYIKTKDSKNYVFAESKPAYHVDENCELLHRDYFNFLIPNKIKALGENEIAHYRKFFQNHSNIKSLPESERQREVAGIVTAIKADYLSRGIELHEHEIFQSITGDNSDNTKFDKNAFGFGERAFVIQNELLLFIKSLKESSDDNDKMVYRMRWLTPRDIRYSTELKSERMRDMAFKLAELKSEYFWALIQYLELNSGFDRGSLDQKLLEDHGFKMCEACAKKYPQMVRFDLSIFNKEEK